MFGFLKDLVKTDTPVTEVAQSDRTELAKAMIDLLVEAAKTDGGIDDEERHIIAHIMAEHFALDEDEMNSLFDEAVIAAKERVDIHSLTRRMRDLTDYEDRLAMLELIWMVVLADEHLDHIEASLMRRLAGLLYIEDVDSGKAAKSAKARLALAE